MCNIHENDSRNELNRDEIERILRDPIFKHIESVGINGGEPFLLKNITEIIETVITTLPSIKNLFIISNGTIPSCPDRIKEINAICKNHNVRFVLSFSIDGYGKMHDEMRGSIGTFEKLMCTINKILKKKQMYCDSLNFICTLTKKNIYYVNELEAFANKIGISITYNIATEHERLKNDIKYQDYSLSTDDKARMLAREFLYSKFRKTKSKTYYALYRYLRDDKPKRYANCQYLHNAITLTPNGDICYCATHSKVLDNVKNSKSNIEKIYFENKEYNDEIRERCCATCSHYMGALTDEAYKDYINELLKTSKKPME
jgi:molybdenum cofactor biosynthesis enzyme MoaA